MLDYVHADAKSLFNTPCYSIYMAGLTFKWIKQQGGVAAIRKKNEQRPLYYKTIGECFTAARWPPKTAR